MTYGWGVIPVTAQIDATVFKTSLFPKNMRCLVPIRVSVQRAENLELGDEVSIRLKIGRWALLL